MDVEVSITPLVKLSIIVNAEIGNDSARNNDSEETKRKSSLNKGNIAIETVKNISLQSTNILRAFIAGYAASPSTITSPCTIATFPLFFQSVSDLCSKTPIKLKSEETWEKIQETFQRLIGGGKNIEDIYPLTPMQQGMVFHSLYNSTSGEYFEQFSWNMDSSSNLSILK